MGKKLHPVIEQMLQDHLNSIITVDQRKLPRRGGDGVQRVWFQQQRVQALPFGVAIRKGVLSPAVCKFLEGTLALLPEGHEHRAIIEDVLRSAPKPRK
ncbi:TPA: hypothetical protein HA244_00435 [Candidatus Micrarchaeota archaeon]|nr:hypothetical protein [Candidatus Micrarchaeota archaeon]